MTTRHEVNEKFYGRQVTGQEILAGAVPLPPAAQPLYEALARCHVYASQHEVSFQQNNSNPMAHHSSNIMMPPPQPQQQGLQGFSQQPSQTAPPQSLFPPNHLNQEYGEMVSSPPPAQNKPPQDPQGPPIHLDQASLQGGMSDITSDPGY
eukprot:CAMPEP_0172444846 /NCGR_PEP_ID=MMETSP1065-20121228/4841_1 /TAXON_ID=265537 /ORGANISM="Amphiprora paludosa, Strain CCMP125" /LENGTH=149 /DNA_ID=CAMNT_0013195549 /DNA_START=98 /DNA_END=547 /DNA_ORIENTATION=+